MIDRNRTLLFSLTKKDFEITYFSGTGAGGQYRNKHQNCVRIKHKETGLIATGQSQRSREQNTKEAFNALVNKKEFKNWMKLKIAQITADKEAQALEINRLVDEAIRPENLLVETYDSGNEKGS